MTEWQHSRQAKGREQDTMRSDIQGSCGPRLELCPAGRVSVGGFTANDYGKNVIPALMFMFS